MDRTASPRAAASTAASRTGVRGFGQLLLQRWPTVLGIVGAFATADAGNERLRHLLILLALEYLVITVIGVRAATWAALLGLGAFFVVASLQDQVPMAAALGAVAVIAVLVGLVRRTERRELALQAGGVLAFGGIALLAGAIDPLAAALLVAAGWFAHGIWDFAHLRRDKVVARTYAEWCGVLDIFVAVALLTTI